jgi:hypothetical protein
LTNLDVSVQNTNTKKSEKISNPKIVNNTNTKKIKKEEKLSSIFSFKASLFSKPRKPRSIPKWLSSIIESTPARTAL